MRTKEDTTDLNIDLNSKQACRTVAFACAVTLFAAVIAFWPPIFLRIGYVWDDVETIKQVASYNNWRSAGSLFSKDYFSTFQELSYRPVATFTYFVDRAAPVSDVLAHRIMQLTLHALCSVLMCILALRLFRSAFWAGIVGVLFAVHPIHAEVVDVLAFREDLLATLFALTSGLLLLHSMSKDNRMWKAIIGVLLATITFALAVFSKESAAPFPAFVLLCVIFLPDGSKSLRSRLLRTLPLWIVLIGYLLVRFVYMKNPQESTVGFHGGSFFAALLTGIEAYGRSFLIVALPRHLSVEYVIVPRFSGALVFGASLLIATLVAILLLRRRAPLVSFGLAWFVLAFSPVSNLVPIANPMADRYLYLPSAGLILALAAICRTTRLHALRIVTLLMILAVPLALLTTERNSLWARSSSEPVWRKSLEVSPDATGIRATLTGFYSGRSLTQQANRQRKKVEALFTKLLKSTDAAGHAVLLYNLGVGAMQSGEHENARTYFERAIALGTDFPRAVHNLSILDMRTGNYDNAEKLLLGLLKTHPGFVDAHVTLGDLYRTQGEFRAAISAYRQAYALQPKTSGILKALGTAQKEAGDKHDALKTFDELVRLYPKDEEAVFLLATAHEMTGNLEAALRNYLHAVSLNPRFAASLNAAASIQYRRKNYADSAKLFRGVIAIDPRSTIAHFNLALCYRLLGKHEKALEHLELAHHYCDPRNPMRARISRELNTTRRAIP